MIRRGILVIVLLLLWGGPTVPSGAQGEVACAPLVTLALETVSASCSDLGRNEACYGNNHVDATFWQPRADLLFSFPGNRVPLNDLHTVATTPLDIARNLWGVAAMQLHAADLPETLPGQAVTFLLMGDTRLENAVSPEEAALPVTPVVGRTLNETDLLGAPSITGNVQAHIPAGTRVQLVGVDDTGGWLEVLLSDGRRAWISRAHLEVDPLALANLPVTYGPEVAPRYGPMQAFYFSTGLGAPACREAPNALLVQSPQQFHVTLSVNQLEIQIGSTILLTTTTGPDGSIVMVIVLLEGELRFELNGQEIVLTEPGQAVGITLNAQGLVDANSEVVDVDADAITDVMQSACQNALQADLFEQPFYAGACRAEVVFPYAPPPLPPVYVPPQSPGATSTPFPTATQEAETACQWPLMTYPPSGTNLVGSGSHNVSFTAVPGATSYQWFIQGDQHNYFTSGTTRSTSFSFEVGNLPSGQLGLGYWVWASPLDANGNPLCPPVRSPNAIWVSKDLGGPRPPAAPVCGNQTCEAGEDTYNCPMDCGGPYCGDGTCGNGEDPYNCTLDCGY